MGNQAFNPYESPASGDDRASAKVRFPDKRVAQRYCLLCAASLGIHAVLWGSALKIEAVRPIYFGLHAVAILFLQLTSMAPESPTLGFVIATVPMVGAILHTSVVCAGGAIGRRFIRQSGRGSAGSGILAGALMAFGLLLLANAIVYSVMRHFGFDGMG